MDRGGLLAATAAILSLSACLGGNGKLEIRSVDNGFKARNEPVSARVADAYGQLAIGNVALALEGFRTASREDAAGVDAFAGMAQCYDKMGRFDLSRRYYEQALAVSPRNATVLALFSNSLAAQGLREEAASVRAELASLAPPAEVPVAQMAAVSPPTPVVSGPVGKSVTIALPPPPPGADQGSVGKGRSSDAGRTCGQIGHDRACAFAHRASTSTEPRTADRAAFAE